MRGLGQMGSLITLPLLLITMAAPPLTMWEAVDCIGYVETNVGDYEYVAGRNLHEAQRLAWDDCEARKRFETWAKAHPRVEYGGPR